MLNIQRCVLSLVVAIASVFGSCGGNEKAPQPPPVINPTAIGFVANTKSNSITAFLLDEATGGVSVASTAPTGKFPGSPAITPDRRLLFVSNTQDGTISRFLLDGNGGMQPVGMPVPLANPGEQPWQLAIAPSGKFLFVATTPGAVEVFRIDPQSGDLAAIANSPFVVPSKAPFLVLTHAGQYLYATGDNSDAIYAFAVDLMSGMLTPLASAPTHTGLANCGMAVDPSDQYLFLATCSAEKLFIFRIQPSGNLQQTQNSPVSSGLSAVHPTVAPNGRFVFIEDLFSSNGILAYSFDSSSGALSPVPGSPFHDGQTPSSVAVSPNSRILVVSRINPGHVASFLIDQQTGALSPISGTLSTSGIPTGDSPNNVVVVPK